MDLVDVLVFNVDPQNPYSTLDSQLICVEYIWALIGSETSQVESGIRNEPILDSSFIGHQKAPLPVRIRHFSMMHAHTAGVGGSDTRFRHLSQTSPLVGTPNVVASLLAAA